MALFIHLLCMESAFFYCHNLSMDIDKLFKKVIASDDIRNVPILFIIMVFNCVLDEISTGECFYETEYE